MYIYSSREGGLNLGCGDRSQSVRGRHSSVGRDLAVCIARDALQCKTSKSIMIIQKLGRTGRMLTFEV